METSKFIYFLISSILLTLAPGPDNLYLLAKSLSDGAKSGITLSLGLASGIFFHTMLVMLGVAALIQNSPIALHLLKYFGAIYLLFLSFNAFRSSGKIKLTQNVTKTNKFSIFIRGIMMNVLNPKVLLFFLAFLPQFVDLSNDSASLHIALLGLTFALQALIIFSIIAIFAGKFRQIIQTHDCFGSFFAMIEGIVLFFIAFLLIFS